MPGIREVRCGDELPPLTKGPLTRQHLVEWCAAENDYYPVHYDEQFAQSMGLAGTPVQGTMKYALLARVIERWLGADGALLRIDAQYRGADFTGDTLTARARVADISPGSTEIRLEVWIENQRGESSTRGEAVVRLLR